MNIHEERGVKPPAEVSHEEQFKSEASKLDGWKPSENPNEGTGGWGGDGCQSDRPDSEESCDTPDCNFCKG